MWAEFSVVVELSQILSFRCNKKDRSGSMIGDTRPDESDYLDDFMVCKCEHRDKKDLLKTAISELSDKLAGYNYFKYGDKIVYLPVIAAAGVLVDTGVIDVRTKVCL